MSSVLSQTRNTAVSNTAVDATDFYTGKDLTASNGFPGGFLRGWSVNKTTAVDSFLQIYDSLAANVTVGTTPPLLSIRIPGGGTVFLCNDAARIPLRSGCSIALTTDEENGSAPVAACTVRLFYEGC